MYVYVVFASPDVSEHVLLDPFGDISTFSFLKKTNNINIKTQP